MSSALGLAELIIRSFSPTFTDPSDEGLYSGAGTLEEARSVSRQASTGGGGSSPLGDETRGK